MVRRSARVRSCILEELETRSLLSIDSPLEQLAESDPLLDPPALIGAERPDAVQNQVPFASPLVDLPFDDSGLSPPGLEDLTALPNLGVFNVRDFGAIGDGAADDTLAIRAAIAAAEAAGGGIIYLPTGEYAVSRQNGDASLFGGYVVPIFHIQSSNLVFIGDGAANTRIVGYMPGLADPETTWNVYDGALSRFSMFSVSRPSGNTPLEMVQFRSLTIDGQAGYTGDFTVGGNLATGDGWDTSHKAIHIDGSADISDVLIFNCDLANWRGEIVYSGGTALQNASIINTTIRSTNASAVSMSGSMLLANSTVGGPGSDSVYNGVENLAFSGDNSVVLDSTIQFARNGLALLGQDSSSATVERTTFQECYRAILLSEAAPNVTVRDSEFIDLEAGAIIWSRLGLYPVDLPFANFSNFVAEGNTFLRAGRVFVLQGTSISGFHLLNNTLEGINPDTGGLTILFADAVGSAMDDFLVSGTTFKAGSKDYQSYSGSRAIWTNTTRESGSYLGSDTWTNNPSATEILFAPASDAHLLRTNSKPAGEAFYAVLDASQLASYPIGYQTAFQVGASNWYLPVDPSWNSFSTAVHVTEGLTIELGADGRFYVVSEANDPPAGTDRSITLNEDSSYTFTATDFGFTDPNDSPPNAFLALRIATLPAAGLLTLSGTAITLGQSIPIADILAGRLRFAPASNAQGQNYASFTFQVRDDGGTANGGVDLDPTPNTMTISVTAANDPPAGTNRSVSIAEDTSYTFSAVDFGFSDSLDSPANAFSAVRIATLPVAGSLTNNGTPATAGQLVSVADIAAGRLRFTPAANANGSSYASFTFQVQDDGGTAGGGVNLDPTPNTITISVTSVNDPPAGANRSVSISEDTSYTFSAVDFGFSDAVDSPPNVLAAVRIASLPVAGQLTLSGSSMNAGEFVTVAQLAAGALRFTPAAHASGSGYASFTFQVRDDGGTAGGGVDLEPTSNTISIAVTSVNDFPLGIDRVVSTQVNVPYAFMLSDFGFHDPADAPPNNFQAVRVTTLPGAGALLNNGAQVAAGQYVSAADILAGRLQFLPSADSSGSGYASFTFQVQDDGGTAGGGMNLDAVPNTMTIDVTVGVSGLVGLWRFDEGSGDVAHDTSGNGNHGALPTGASFASGMFGTSLVMTHASRWIPIPNSPSLNVTGAVTLAAWISPVASGTQTILAKSVIHEVDGFELSLSNSGKVFVRFNQRSSGDAFRVDSTSSYPTDGAWMHVVATYDGTAIRLYINGILQGAKAASFAIASNSLDLGIGADSAGGRGMRGRIDEALIANRALSPAEVAALFAGTLLSSGVTNAPPTVDAGTDAAGHVGAAVSLSGQVSDDGFPLSSSLTSLWSVVSGPGNVSFGNPALPATTATFSAAGVYVLRLTANDGSLSASDEVTIQASTAGTPALLGFWNFLPGVGGRYPSAIGHLGELQGGAAVSTDGRLTLAAAGQSYLVPDLPALQITQAITLAAWIKPATGGAQSIVKKAAGSTSNGFELGLSDSGKVFVRFNEQNAGNGLRVDSTSNYPTTGTNWMHVAATYDGSTIRLYINGQLQGSQAASFAIGTNGQPLLFGSGLIGQMDEVVLDSRAFTAAEVDDLYRGRLQPAEPANRAPAASAGSDQSAQVGTLIALNGSAIDDGQPTGQLTYQWVLVTGPGAVNFGNANAAQTTATFATSGLYHLRLWASDGSLASSDDLMVTVMPAAAPAGIVGYWRFEDNGSTVSDSSDNQNVGSLQGGATIGAGQSGGGLFMSQAEQSLVVPHSSSLSPTERITIAAWIAPIARTTQTVVSKASMNSVNGYELALSNNGKVFVRFNQASGGDALRVDSKTNYSTSGNWLHVAATYDGTVIRLYVNGVLEGSKSASFAIAANALGLGVGAEASGARGMRGRIDDVLIANRAFSQAEITALIVGASPLAEAAPLAVVAQQPLAEPESRVAGLAFEVADPTSDNERSAAATWQDRPNASSGRRLVVDRAIGDSVDRGWLSSSNPDDVHSVDELARAILARRRAR